MEKLSFVIPCYRSEKSISHVVEEIVHTVDGKIISLIFRHGGEKK